MQVCRVLRLIFFNSIIGSLLSFPATVFAAGEIYPIDLKRQSLHSALNELAEIARFQWGATRSGYFESKIAAPLKGYFTARQAVAELLKGSGIEYEWVDDKVLRITGTGLIGTTVPLSKKPVEPIRKIIEEITVVGSHIRGSNPAAPVVLFDREDIQNSGLTTTQDFLNRLPQVFGGGASEGPISAIKGKGATFNIANGNGINLRGMGFESTLLLLNGHRLAPVGFGDVVDVSGIPLNAIDRIEVMTDGASAIYGSDAIGGVVNIILRNHYEGSETSVGYGHVSSGNNQSYRLNQTFGKHWPTGSVLFSYTYQQRDNLSTEDRSATRSAADPSDILGEITHHNVIFSFSQQLTEQVDLSMDIFHNTRETEQNKATFGGNIKELHTIRHSNLVAGFGVDLSDSWRMDSNILYSGSSTNYGYTGAYNGYIDTAFDTWLVDAKVDGEILDTRGGASKLALGGQYRQEALSAELATITTILGKEKITRQIASVFTELFMPLVSEGNRLLGVERLEFTLAGRHEKYSDFGSSTNPKIGLLWSPVNGLNVRTTFSKSFRAPLLFEQSKLIMGELSVVSTLVDPLAPDGITPSIIVEGYNSSLQPEKAVNWTIGTDIAPASWDGFRCSLTYFSIKVTDRIQTALGFFNRNDALVDPHFAPLVIRNPDMSLINFWASKPNFTNIGNLPLSEIGVFIDNRLLNIAALRERGLNFTLDYSLDTDLGEFIFHLDGTYLLALETRATDAAPFVDILNAPYNPVDLKLRNSVSWRRDGLTTTAFVNYVDNYKDSRSGEEINIDAWMTMDLNIRYNIEQSLGSWLQGAVVSLSVNNLFDSGPPFVTNALGYNFDAANANAIGRRFSLEFTKKW